jgi:adenylosuccinate synthase
MILSFKSEVDGLAKFNLDLKSKLIISRKAHLIPTHRLLDAASEASKEKQKLVLHKGIGPTYMDKTGRNEFVWRH